MLNVKKLLENILKNIPRQKYGTSTTSFSAAMPSNGTENSYYIGLALDSMNGNIANLNTGIHHQSSGTGPQFGIVLYKLRTDYYCGLVLSYSAGTDLVYFKCNNEGYQIRIDKPSIIGGGVS